MYPFELDEARRVVRTRSSFGECPPESTHCEHAASRSHDTPVVCGRPGVEDTDARAFGRGVESSDLNAGLVVAGITARCEHNRNAGLRRPLEFRPGEIAGCTCEAQLAEVRTQTGDQGLGLGVAETSGIDSLLDGENRPIAILRDHDTLARREPISLDDVRRTEFVHICDGIWNRVELLPACRRYPCAVHELLRVTLRALDARSACVRAEHAESFGPERVADTGNERRLRSNHHESGPQLLGERYNCGGIVDGDPKGRRELRNSCVARSGDEFVYRTRSVERPRERTLAAAGPEEENPHAIPSCIGTISSRPGPTEAHDTGAPLNSSKRSSKARASLGRSSIRRADRMSSRQPGISSKTGLHLLKIVWWGGKSS